MKRSKDVEKYLLNQGIERLTEEQIAERFISGERFGKSWRRFLYKLIQSNVPIEKIPAYYDTFQSRQAVYDYRKGLLDKLTRELYTLDDGAVIMDGGCGTGIDIFYLALNFPNMHFLGYDKSKGMVRHAEQRGQDLENVEFYQNRHLEPYDEELKVADLVYTSESLSRYHSLDEYFEEFEAICKRVKPNGIYIRAGSTCILPEEAKESLSDMGIHFVRSSVISTASEKKMKGLGNAKIGGSIVPVFYKDNKQTQFYMNVFEVNLPE